MEVYLDKIKTFESKIGKDIFRFDSLLRVQLIVYLEEELNLKFRTTSLSSELFESYENILYAISISERRD